MRKSKATATGHRARQSQSCSGEEVLNEFNVLGLGVLLRESLLGVPCVPLGLSFQVEHAGALGVDVSDGGLLEERVDLELLLVGEVGGDSGVGLELLGDGFELFLERHF